MKSSLNRINQAKYFLLFVFLFSYAQSIQIRLLVRRKIDVYIFTPEAAIAGFMAACTFFMIMNFLIARWQKSNTFNWVEILKIFGCSLILFTLISNSFSLLIAIAFDKFEKNFNSETLMHNSISDLMNAFVYGSFFLGYYYYRKNSIQQKQISSYNQALAETKINQLKAQLNPHFLFNNLNALDQLIEEDQNKASDFLNEFAEIYRYVLQVSDKKTITIKEELAFAEKYFNLMKYKYGDVYLLEIETLNLEKNIVPLTLQLLLENAIQHNLGTFENPICIKIKIKEDIKVSNNIVPKRNSKVTSGRALINLREQYSLLTNQAIEINKSENDFVVNIPIIS